MGTSPTRPSDAARLERLVELGMSLAGSASELELLQRLADSARELAGARYAAIGVLGEEGGLREFVTSGIDEGGRARIGDLPVGRGLLGAIVTEEGAVRIEDIASDARSVGFPPGHPPMTSFLGAPIHLGGRVYGSIYTTERVDGPFTADDQRLIETLAVYAAIAVSNTSRFEEQQAMLRGFETLFAITRSIRSDLAQDELLPDVARRARALLECDTVGVGLIDGQRVSFAHAHGTRALPLESFTADSSDTDRLGERLATELECRAASVVEMQASGRPIGLLVALCDAPLSAWREHALHLLADHVASTMVSAESFSEQRHRMTVEAERQVQRLEERLTAEARRRTLAAQEDERSRIARELHDDTAQLITGLSLRLKALGERCEPDLREEVDALREHVREMSASMQGTLRRLRPTDLQRGLSAAITDQAERVREVSGCSIDVQLGPLPPLSDEVELVLFRAAQEALMNVARHSEAAEGRVTLKAHHGRLRLTVEDDGRGFDPSRTGDRLGLEGIAERVSLVGGRFRVASAAGAGTAVIVDVPSALGDATAVP